MKKWFLAKSHGKWHQPNPIGCLEVQATSQACPVPRLESWAHFCTCKSFAKEWLNSQALQSVCRWGKFPVARSRLQGESRRCGPPTAERRRRGRREHRTSGRCLGSTGWSPSTAHPPREHGPCIPRGVGEGIYLPKGQFIFTGDLGSLIVSSFLKLTCKMRSYKPGTEASREGGEALSLKHHQASFASPTPHPQIALPSAFCPQDG